MRSDRSFPEISPTAEGADSASIGAELLIASGGVGYEEPPATCGRGAAGAADETGDFAGEALPESGAESGGPVAHLEARPVLVRSGQVERSAGEACTEFPVEHVASAQVSRRDTVPYPGWYYPTVTETMSYNVNGQLTSRNWATAGAAATGLSYSYSATQNNGQITQMTDSLSGETVTYQYDALKRLTSAASTPNAGSTTAAWTQTYQYDGFGNLTAKVLNGTTTPISIDPATNRLSGTTAYDANGNFISGGSNSYDGRNRFSGTTWPARDTFFYDPSNHRVYQGNLTLYGAYGERLATYGFVGPFDTSGSMGIVYSLTLVRTNVWFNGRNVSGNTVSGSGVILPGDSTFYQDRVGTDRSGGARYRPYGEEITSTSNDRVKFGTYIRDSATGMDYADQRYYASAYGRFNTPDPDGRSVHAKRPGSWNRYVYASDDPVNRNDPSGRIDCWSWYLDVINSGYDPDDDTLGNCADGGGGNTSMELDPCTVQNQAALSGLGGGASCGLQVFTSDLGHCTGASSCMAFAGGTGDNTGFGTSTIDPSCTPQQIVGSVVESDAATAGLNLNGLTATVQMVGTPCSSSSLECVFGMWSMTELDLTGDTSALAGSIASSSFSCLGSNPIGNLFIGAAHPGYLGNCRQAGLTNSLQVNFNSTGAQIDIDPFNPSSVPPLGTLLHGVFQVLPNLLSGSDTNYSTVAGVLGISVSCQ